MTQLRAFVERIERLEEEISTLNADKSEVYKEAKATGFDVKVLRKVIAARRMDRSERQEAETLFDLYMAELEGSVRAHVENIQQFVAAGSSPSRATIAGEVARNASPAPIHEATAMSRPRALDLFCCAGGASVGLHRAGFDVVGVDINPQPHYPFEFRQADALTFPLSGFDFIWASPPCQAHSKTRAIHGKDYPDLIPQTRERLEASGTEWAMENVPGAPLRNAVVLCGTMFGLKVIRHRHFETSFDVGLVPQCGRHGSTNSHRGYSTGAEFVTVAGNNYRRVEGAAAMDIDWYMPRDRLSQAIPPAYSEFIGRAALGHLNSIREAA